MTPSIDIGHIARPSLDLGPLDGPVLLFGGPYSNLQATEALRAEAERLGIPPSNVICTGDVVAYCGDPDATIDAIRDWGCAVAMGNCEEALGEGGEDCRCGFEKGSQCDLLSVRWFAHASARVSADQKAWMAALPHPVTFELAGARVAVVHGHSRDISEWVFASTPEAEKRVALDDLDADIVVAGDDMQWDIQTAVSRFGDIQRDEVRLQAWNGVGDISDMDDKGSMRSIDCFDDLGVSVVMLSVREVGALLSCSWNLIV